MINCDNPLSKGLASTLNTIRIGRKLQQDHPEIRELAKRAMTAADIVKNLQLASSYQIDALTAEKAVLYAMRGDSQEQSIEKNLEEMAKGTFAGESIIAPLTSMSQELYDRARFGEPKEDKIYYALVEGLYLYENKKLRVVRRNKNVAFDEFLEAALEVEPSFWTKYCVFKDMRSRGYIVKTALKFGADFRVYDRGVKPGEDHAKWILYAVHEGGWCGWNEFSAKNRVAHSTRKNLLIGIVDNENEVTYYNIDWIRP